ncbi:DNA primase [Rhodovulum sp. DZ06]|uniref:DNA primase n=1 Tax=Rhodovulum sp. DZ06 TaxID=3425126 RepID=UPI003D346BC0
MSLPNGFLDELRARVSLTSIVGRKVTWDRKKSSSGRGDWWAPCPFHHEKSSSFHVLEGQGFYKCFGCGASGDHITFLREMENMSFMEAVRALAEEAGMEMPDRDPRAAAREEARKGLTEVAEIAARWFGAQLTGARAEAAREYLKGRGMTGRTAKDFGIGFAPPGDGLQEHLAAKNIPVDDMIKAGLIAKSDDGRTYPRFRDRIIFPIRDARGRCISFGGRAMQKDAKAKYLNGPETPLFDKSRNLYNLDKARGAAGRKGRLIVAEGYMDVIALAQAGFEEAVAPLGTAVTEMQLQMMWRVCPEPIIALDGDAAGLRAAYRVIDLALPHLSAEHSLRFCLMPDGLDPDDLIRERGPEAMEEALAASAPLVEMLWRRETDGKSFDSPERRAGLDARLAEAARKIGDRRLRRHYIDALQERRCALFGIDPAQAARPAPPREMGPRDAGPRDFGPPDMGPPMDAGFAPDYGPGYGDGPDYGPDFGPEPGYEPDYGFDPGMDPGRDAGFPPPPAAPRGGPGGAPGMAEGAQRFARGGAPVGGQGGYGGGFGGGKGGGFGGGRRRQGFGGRGAPRIPGGPARETMLSALARIAATGQGGRAAAEAGARLRESAILAGALGHPDAALALEDSLAEAPFMHPDLSAIRDAVIGALSETPADAEGALDRAAFRALVDARIGGDAWAAAGASRAAGLTRALAPGSDPDAAKHALEEALDRHSALVSAEEEMQDAARSLLEGEAGEDLTHRLAAAARARDGAGAAQRNHLAEDGDEEAVRRLQGFSIPTRSGRKG